MIHFQQTLIMKRALRSIAALLPPLVVAGLVGASASAHAATVVNADPVAHELAIIEKNERRSETLAPSQTRDDLCPDGCTLTLKGKSDATYTIEGRAHVTIEDGLIYWDRRLPPPGAADATDDKAATQ